MGWVLRLVENEAEGPPRSVDLLAIERPGDLRDLAALGLTQEEGKRRLARLQQALVAAQCRDHAAQRPACRVCGAVCHVKDYRPHRIATLFGQVTARLPRFRCVGCGVRDSGVEWPRHGRSTPELDQLRAHLSALMPYRVAAGVLNHLLPLDAGTAPETLRAHTLTLGAHLVEATAAEPTAPATAITLSVDSTFIRSCDEGSRHLEVRLGNAETPDGARQVFAAVTKTDTAIAKLIRRSLAAVGQSDGTELSAFTDGCPGLRALLVEAGVSTPPFLDWFHIAMRLQHAEATAGILPTKTPEQERAKAEIVTEVDRLHWRIWNGKAKDAQITLERIHAVLPAFQGETSCGSKIPPVRRLWTALRTIDRYLTSQSAWLTNYAERHRAGQRVGTALTEGTANLLVNRRMNKSQQMRWSRCGADLLLQVRCAILNGKLGCTFGQLFTAETNPPSDVALAA